MFVLPKNDDNPKYTYSRVYEEILQTRRKFKDSSVVMLVPPEPDALCGARILSTLFAREDVRLNIIPVAGYPSLQEEKEILLKSGGLHHLFLINIGSVLDIAKPEWFGDFPSSVTIHIIDSARPFELANLFGGIGPSPTDEDDEDTGPRVIVWDDGHALTLTKERAAFESGEYGYNSEDEEDDEDEDEDLDDDESSEEEYEDGDERGKRRRSASNDGRRRRKRRSLEDKEQSLLSREERRENRAILEQHYSGGTHHGQSAAGIAYTLCTIRECSDINILWLAILGLTHQFVSSRISTTQYEHYYDLLNDEAVRLGVPIINAPKGQGDNYGVMRSTEFRFPLMRNWNLYDAMMHSGYVANKFTMWKETGPKRLNRLLTKMGLSLQQSQQGYFYMNPEIRETLAAQIDNFGPECGLVEPTYASFTKSYGNEMSRTSAADVLAGITALLEAAKGVKLMVQVEGGKGGGELFGTERIWDLRKQHGVKGKENIPLGGEKKRLADGNSKSGRANTDAEDEDTEDADDMEIDGDKVWRQNFWLAFDALGTNTSLLRQSIPLAISLQRAIVRQGRSILEKGAIKHFTDFRLIKITEGPDLATFAHPSTLTRLTLWLVEATRDKIPAVLVARRKKANKSAYPFVVACFNERKKAYLVVGVTGAPDMNDTRKNHFGHAFLRAKDISNARTRHGTFETSVIEVNAQDFPGFIEALSE